MEIGAGKLADDPHLAAQGRAQDVLRRAKLWQKADTRHLAKPPSP